MVVVIRMFWSLLSGALTIDIKNFGDWDFVYR